MRTVARARSRLILILLFLAVPTVPGQSYFLPGVWSQTSPGCSGARPIVADFDQDGRCDVVSAGFLSTTLTCWSGDGAGGFGGAVTTSMPQPLSASPRALFAATDLTGDGVLDVVAESHGGVVLLSGNGDGTFAPTTTPAFPGDGGAELADVDGDGIAEVVQAVTSSVTGGPLLRVLVWQSGAFALGQTLVLPLEPTDVAIADFDGDGDVEVWVTGALAGAFAHLTFTNDGSGGFAPTLPRLLPTFGTHPTTGQPQHQFARDVRVADVDGDGREDLVAQLEGGGLSLGVFAGTASGEPAAPRSFSTGAGVVPGSPTGLIVRDFDGDGLVDAAWLDVVFAPGPTYPIALYRGLGTPTGAPFVPIPMYTSLPQGLAPPEVEAGDLDGDGDPDLVVTAWPPAGVAGGCTVLATLLNESTTGPGTPGAAGIPTLTFGPLHPGSVSGIELSGARPNATALLGLSLQTAQVGLPPHALWLDPTQLLSPHLPTGFGVLTTDGLGRAAQPFSLPTTARGLTVYAQWLIADPSGLFPTATTNLALSPAHKAVIW